MSNTNFTIEQIRKMPKLDLHCHLDGSFSLDYVSKTLSMPDLTMNRLCVPKNCNSLAEYLTCFDLPIACLQTRENIIKGVLDVLANCKADGIAYAELRFAPTCSVNENLSLRDVVEAAIEGAKQGFILYQIPCNIILCAMRHHSLEDNLKVLQIAREYLGLGVCALDLAGDEAGFSNHLFTDLFQEAVRIGMPFTIHSGECGSVENVKLALSFGAARVGHGIALYKDYELMKEYKKARLGLELCPTSNFQTKACTDYEMYPLRQFLDASLLATVNTDNRTVSATTMTDELMLCMNHLHITSEDLQTLYRNSVEISFADDTLKHKLLSLA